MWVLSLGILVFNILKVWNEYKGEKSNGVNELFTNLYIF